MQVWKQTGIQPDGLKITEPHEGIFYLWEWFCSLRRSERLTFQEIESWSRLMKISPSAREVEVLMKLDSIVSRELDNG